MNFQYLTPEILISVAATIIVGALGVLIGYKLRPQKRPVISYSNTLVQSSNHPKVKILYDNEEVLNLHAYNLVFWNHGNVELRKGDIPLVNGPHFQPPKGSKILSVAYNASDLSSNVRLEMSPDSTKAYFKFDFLNPKEGLSAQILYATSEEAESEEVEPEIVGALVGAPKILAYKWPNESKVNSFFISLIPFLMSALSALFAVGTFSITASGIIKSTLLFILSLVFFLGSGLISQTFVVQAHLGGLYGRLHSLGLVKNGWHLSCN